MKLLKLFIKASLVTSSILVITNLSWAQTGNMSDITGPNPGEVISEPSESPEPTVDNTPNPEPDSDVVDNTNPNQGTEPNANIDIQPEPEPIVDNNPTPEPTDTVDNTPETETEPTAINNSNSEEATDTVDSEEQTETAQEEQEETNPEKPKNNSEEKKEITTSEPEVDRIAYEAQVQQASTDVAVQLQEEFQATQLVSYSGVQLYGQPPSVGEISRRLGELWRQTGKKPAFISVSLQSNRLETFTVLPNENNLASQEQASVISHKSNQPQETALNQVVLRQTIKNISRRNLLTTAEEFRTQISDPNQIGQTNYLSSSQQLYNSLIAPIEADLKANKIDILVFSMDSGLRLLPIGALYDGQQFLIEKYAVALVPSFGLTDTRYVDIRNSPILAMGASNFKEQKPLPTVPLELREITRNPRQGNVFLNEEFTVANFETQSRSNQPYKIIHLGTHADFQAENSNDSYIQFYDQKVGLPQLRQISTELGWNTANKAPIELLVLSACQTAMGNEKAELGFAGLAVQAGVKSTLASLWYVSDLGTLALMSEFYEQLSNTLIKAEALRETQMEMLRGKVMVERGQLKLSNGESLPLPAQFPQGGKLALDHPYFWSPFILIGNWN
jgi:CHAT domain-containing protein